MVYRGIGPEAGKRIEGEADALAYALAACGVMPTENWAGVDPDFAGEVLRWFYSGNWIREHPT